MDREYLFIASGLRELEALLTSIPDTKIIERMSLESRLESAREALNAFLSSRAEESADSAPATFPEKSP